MRYQWCLVVCAGFVLASAADTARAAEPPTLRSRATEGLKRATNYFRKEVATHGGYLWRYSEDLSRREGERDATSTMVWVQPPGTPSVGLAYLGAFHATGDESLRHLTGAGGDFCSGADLGARSGASGASTSEAQYIGTMTDAMRVRIALSDGIRYAAFASAWNSLPNSVSADFISSTRSL